ncbi:MAG: helix-turn-helix transcriptional regulator [Lentisphaeria bacterium]|nr:helix-turn-helix transcriptional regulator [Lentisphaeria bacterium]
MEETEYRFAVLERCGFFICSPVDCVLPVTIPEGEEYIEILAGGKLFFEVDGREKEMPLGTVFWHIAGEKTICRTSAKDPYRCYVFLFRVNSSSGRPSPRISQWKEGKNVLEFASECLHTYQNGKYDRELFSRYVYSTLQWHTLMDDSAGREYPIALCNALRYMDQHYAKCRLSAAEIAVNAGISRPYLFDLCRNFLGQTPCGYLQEKRVKQAERLLMTSSLPIKDIAEKCGFSSIEVFYRCFRRISGRTPGDYRNTYSIYPG